MTSLASGFCNFVQDFCRSAPNTLQGGMNDFNTQPDSLWNYPVLQIIDTQQFKKEGEPPRLYLALSDGRTLLWGVVPPGTKAENAVLNGDVEVGGCLCVTCYGIVTAANHKRLIVLVEITPIGGILSLIGKPHFDESLYKLSSQSLLAKQAAAAQESHAVFLDHLFENPLHFEAPSWEVSVRVVWKSKLRRLGSGMNSDSSLGGGNEGGRFVFDARIVDGHGNAAHAVFWTGKRIFESVDVNDCITLGGGTIKYAASSAGGHPQPSELHFGEKSKIANIQEDPGIPKAARKEFGAALTLFKSVMEAQTVASIGDTVSVCGVVTKSFPCELIAARGGQVYRRSLTIMDCASPAHTMDVTLWDTVATSVDPTVGSTWCFRDMKLGMFGVHKTINSRSNSEVYLQPPKAPEHGGGGGEGEPAGGGAGVANPNVVDERGNKITILFDLAKGDESTHILVRVQNVRYPCLYTACNTCGKKNSSGTVGAVAGAPSAPCSCGDTRTEMRFMISAELSDGQQCIHAVGYTLAGEGLFAQSTVEFVDNCARVSSFQKEMCTDVVGEPVLVKLSKSHMGEFRMEDVKRVDQRHMAEYLLLELESRAQ